MLLRDKFFYEKGYYEAYSVHDLDGAFINFLEAMYDPMVAKGYKVFVEDIIADVWEDEYNLKDDLDYEGVIYKFEEKICHI